MIRWRNRLAPAQIPWHNPAPMSRLAATFTAAFSIAIAPMLAVEPERAAGALGLLRQLDEGFVQVFEKVAPTVVVIEATKKVEEDEKDEIKGFEFFFNGEKGQKIVV